MKYNRCSNLSLMCQNRGEKRGERREERGERREERGERECVCLCNNGKMILEDYNRLT